MANRITMSDVARQAGVSLMTVSRVINQKGDVSPATRQRVQEVIEQSGYRPSGIARSLATRRTSTLGLVVPDVSNPYFSGIAQGVAEVAYAQGFSVLLCDSEESPARELNLLQVLEEKRVDGVVLCASRLDPDGLGQALARHPDVVLVNRQQDSQNGAGQVGCVLNDDETGGYLATKHLIERGHSLVGFLSGPVASFGGQRRRRGFKAALVEAGCPLHPEFIQPCPPTVAGGRQAALGLIAAHPEITALYCYNDMAAIGALQACAELARPVPAGLAIVGYDDIPMAAWVTPPLTTIRVSFTEMGRLATQLLIDRLQGCSEGCDEIVLQPELVIRASAP